jgi:hypothetical protein
MNLGSAEWTGLEPATFPTCRDKHSKQPQAEYNKTPSYELGVCGMDGTRTRDLPDLSGQAF